MLNTLTNGSGFNSLVRGRYGYMLFNRNDVYVGHSIARYGEFSEQEVAVLRQICRPDDLVIEVGANIGAHTLALSAMVGPRGRIFALEPQRIVFQTLCANLAINSIDNVEALQVAASSKKGHVLIPDIRYDVPGNFGGVDVTQFTVGSKVPTARLDKLLDVPHLRLLKVDVEGMEREVLKGAAGLIEKHQPALYVENDRVKKSRPLIELIQSMDYQLYWHRPPMFNPCNHAQDPENIFPHIVSINMLCVPRRWKTTIRGFEEILDPAARPSSSGTVTPTPARAPPQA